MKLKENDLPYKVINGDMLKVLPTFEENTFDSCITDPPYELTSINKRFGKENSKPAKHGKDGSFSRLSKGFMGQTWDGSGIAFNVDAWKEVYRVLKPGAYLLAFGGSRTFHRMAVAIEDAGFEIRDTIMWLYGSGFPKSHNIGLAVDEINGVESKIVGKVDAPDLQDIGTKQKELGNGHKMTFGQIENAERTQYEIKEAQNEWKGWGTALKPAFEPIIVARKPISENSVAQNCLKWGVGGINIDECRVGQAGGVIKKEIIPNSQSKNCGFGCNGKQVPLDMGRFPANVITDGSDEVASGMPETKSSQNGIRKSDGFNQNDYGKGIGIKKGQNNGEYGDEGSAMRYFYQAKASKKDRDEGLDMLEDGLLRRVRPDKDDNNPTGLNTDPKWKPIIRKNIHPTVKPVELMQYLIRLVTRKGGVILEPFAGSGSTGKATMFENRERNANYKIVMVELTKEYIPIIEARCDYALNKYEYDLAKEKIENEKKGILDLFDFVEEDL